MFGGDRSNDLGQNLSKSKKVINLAKFRKLKNYPKLFTIKKAIFKISINLTKATNAIAIGYQIAKTRIAFICLSQTFTK